MRRIGALALLLVPLVISVCARQREPGVFALERHVHEIARGPALWPGYDPLAVPLAVCDGTNTYLFRHPKPPEEFSLEGDAYVFHGRHPAVVANSSASIGGVRCATVLLNSRIERDKIPDLAAVVAHEGFHVFQGTTGRRWGADETVLFLYPMDDPDLLTLRRLETEALRRAFDARENGSGAGWAKQALEMRDARFAKMDACFSAYERGIETIEGTANYVELRAAGRSAPRLPENGFPVGAVRFRAYGTGAGWAVLLDRFRPGWRDGFAGDDSRFLDKDLRAALEGMETPAACAFSDTDRAAAAEEARKDVSEFREARARLQEHVESSPGWRLVIEADPGAPLWSRGFDPMNVRPLDCGLLHTRFLNLGNEQGTMEVMGDTVLTEGVGPHPLFNGIRRATVVGLDAEPAVRSGADTVAIESPTVTARFRSAEIERSGRRITVRIHSPGQRP